MTWLAPLAVTLVALALAWLVGTTHAFGRHGEIPKGMANAILFLIAVIVSLAAWLIWSLL